MQYCLISNNKKHNINKNNNNNDLNFSLVFPLNAIYVTFSSGKNKKRPQDDGHIIASTYFTNKSITIPHNNFLYNLMPAEPYFVLRTSYFVLRTSYSNTLKIKKCILWYVCSDYKDKNIEDINYRYGNLILVIKCRTPYTFIECIANIEFFESDNIYSFYIFISIPWNSVVRLFIDQGHGQDVTIRGASTRKRHMLSQLDIRLNAYLLAIFDMNPSQVAKHNAFYNISKRDYLPRFYFTDKKKIH